MKKKIRFTLLLLGMFLLSGGIYAQGIFHKNETDNSSTTTSEKGLLGAGEDDGEPGYEPVEPGEPGNTPVGDGVFVLLAAMSIYGVKAYRDTKRQKLAR